MIILGDSCVGKTSLLKAFTGKRFEDSHMITLGVDYVAKAMRPEGSNQEISVKIWDTAG